MVGAIWPESQCPQQQLTGYKVPQTAKNHKLSHHTLLSLLAAEVVKVYG